MQGLMLTTLFELLASSYAAQSKMKPMGEGVIAFLVRITAMLVAEVCKVALYLLKSRLKRSKPAFWVLSQAGIFYRCAHIHVCACTNTSLTHTERPFISRKRQSTCRSKAESEARA